MFPKRDIKIPMFELADTELDLVFGGLFDYGNNVVQVNAGVHVDLSFGGLSGQLIGLSNISVI